MLGRRVLVLWQAPWARQLFLYVPVRDGAACPVTLQRAVLQVEALVLAHQRVLLALPRVLVLGWVRRCRRRVLQQVLL